MLQIYSSENPSNVFLNTFMKIYENLEDDVHESLNQMPLKSVLYDLLFFSGYENYPFLYLEKSNYEQ